MSTRRAREVAGGVMSFTFLDVLMCTMGSLLLLLAVFAARTKQDAAAARTAASAAVRTPNDSTLDDEADNSAESVSPETLAAALKETKSQIADLAQSMAKATEIHTDEKARLAHLEEHQRRLEKELAELHFVLKELKAAERNEQLDLQQAEKEAARLEAQIAEREKALRELQSAANRKKSFAIIPYKGANGTYRRPLYIECVRGGVVLQPEGISLSAQDLRGANGAGNPLASAIRAANETLANRAVKAGVKDYDPAYPLIIVRPSGVNVFDRTVDAVSSWDSDFGYEFVEEDLKLQFSEQDPQIVQAMIHAIGIARERQSRLAQAAPSRYARISGGGGSDGGGGGGAPQESVIVGETSGEGQSESAAINMSPEQAEPTSSSAKPKGRFIVDDAKSMDGIWMSAAPSRSGSPVTRPIRITVRVDELIVVPTGDDGSFNGAVITLEQPGNKVLDALAKAIREQTDDWGDAGRDMYWRPMIVLDANAGAERHAEKLAEILVNGGLDVRISSNVAAQGQTHQGAARGSRR